jgi:hypothetical protein
MPTRLIRKTAILLKTETTYGTDAVPAGAANAMLVSNLSINPLNAKNVDRDNIRPYFGGSEQLVGVSYIECGFDIELVGGGTAGTAPAWGAALQACGFSEIITLTTRVDYLPVSDALTSVTIYWYDDGVLHKLLGARGDVTFKMSSGDRPVMQFKFTGLDGGLAAAVSPTIALAAFKTPQVVTDANTQDVTLGCTHLATGAPALVGGTVFPSLGLELMAGNSVSHTPLLGGETVEITDRSVTGKLKLDLSAAQEVAAMGDVKAAALTSLGLVHGTVIGSRVLVFMPAVQRINHTKEEMNGKRLIGYDLRIVPTLGNDELRIVTSF